MTNLKSLLFFTILILGLGSCASDEEGVFNQDTLFPEPQEIFSTSLYGRVIDSNDQPIQNAVVSLKSGQTDAEVQTDEFGQFEFRGIINKGASAFLSVQSNGKFEAFRRYGVVKDRNNYTEIKMQEKSIIGTVAATQGGILDNGAGAEIELPANGIINASGTAYDGNVSVAMAWIDPSAPDLAAQMVGDLSAIDMEGNPRSLATYGMLQIELLDASGNELNIAPGNTATLQFPVPTELRASAPSTIPLWSYDEEVGTWIEEGSAVYDNGVYRGSVTHFSSWNVDFPYDPIEITGEVKFNIEGTPVEGGYLSVYVQSDEIGKKGGWLCDDGSFRFYNFPKAYQNDEDLGAIVVENTSAMITIKGNALNCDYEVVTEGSVSVKVNGRNQNFEIGEDGSFEFALDICEDGTADVTIVDLATFLQASFGVDDSQEVWQLNDTRLCDQLTDFISISVNGEEPMIFTPGVGYNTYQDSMSTSNENTISFLWSFEDQNSYSIIQLAFKNPNTGTPFTSDAFIFRLVTDGLSFSEGGTSDLQLVVTEHNNVSGGFIKGTFSGTVIDDLIFTPDPSVMVTGEFHVPIP